MNSTIVKALCKSLRLIETMRHAFMHQLDRDITDQVSKAISLIEVALMNDENSIMDEFADVSWLKLSNTV